ncbi:MAG: hypothetical protein SV583_06585 [Pseudomonadota bacterium]|nr:hypothetical protein [Pseudomonadota bacterium]
MKLRLCLALCLLGEASLASTPWVIGEALDAETGELLYTEHHHRPTDERTEFLIEYRGPSGEVWAEKYLGPDLQTSTPSFTLNDLRLGEYTRVQTDSEHARVTYREDAEARTEQGVVALAANLVIDAGFDAFVRSHWTALATDNQTLPVQFLVPARLKTYDFELQATPVDDSDTRLRKFVLEPAGFLLSMVVPPFRLTYASDSRQLMRFEGLSNLTDPDTGKPYRVRIEYRVSGAPTGD